MTLRFIIHTLGSLGLILAMAMLWPLAFAVYYHEDIVAISLSIAVTAVISAMMMLLFKPKRIDISYREGFVIVAFGWLMAGFFGALPFFFGKTFGPMGFESFINSYFESISGFTTTGASVLGHTVMIESLGHGILFWRSLTHWLGGMGIIVLTIAILPLLGIGGMQLFGAEMPGPTTDKLKPRIKETAKTLWKVYILLSLTETILLMFGGLNLFEALCQTFGTMATGGFSTRNASIGTFGSAYIDIVITVFMFMAGCNFALHYSALRGKVNSYWKDSEFRFYLIFVGILIMIVTLCLYFEGVYSSLTDSIRYGAFQTISMTTSTGFVTADFNLWPSVLKFLLICMMFLGACAGSTSGSVKMIRVMIIFKLAYRQLVRLIHPKAFVPVKLGKKVIDRNILEGIVGFVLFYFFIFIVATIILTFLKIDLVSAISASAACLGTVGPGLGIVGPMSNYDQIPLLGKIVLSFCMVLGRLEIYTVLVLLVPEFWRK
ncbi:TrkH family potassium uptake protein [bacterium]|nr:TrkH family potassium uptake protein [bacterium]